MEYTEEDGLRLVAAFVDKLAARPVRARYPVATESSTTDRGGKIISTSSFCVSGGRVALVGDIVRYPDGSEARIVSGVLPGAASVYQRPPLALVGSELDNGDFINGPMHAALVIVQYADDAPITSLRDTSDFPTHARGPLV